MKKLVVAIFESDEINRFIWTNLVKVKENLEVHIFENPEQGLLAARTIDFDVVIIETHFWGQNFFGLSILKELKAVSRQFFVSIATTALLQEGDLEKTMAAGFTMCMEKPLSLENIEKLQRL